MFDCFSHSYSHCLWHLPKAACELSEALRNLTLKLYSDHLSEDGKVTHCFTNSSHTAYQTDAKPCSMDSPQTRTLHALIFDVRGGWMTWASLCQCYVLNKKGTCHCDRLGLHFWPDSWLQGHIQEPVLRAVLWSSCPASACGAAVSESWRETGFLYQHLQCPRHPREPASGLSQKHMAKVSGKRSGDFVFLSTVKVEMWNVFSACTFGLLFSSSSTMWATSLVGRCSHCRILKMECLEEIEKVWHNSWSPFPGTTLGCRYPKKRIPLWVYII